MGLIPISETQISFGYFHSFLNVNGGTRFVLPSIRQEGGRVRFDHPGADLVLNNNHLIQFKRPSQLYSDKITEFTNYNKPSEISPPYFRFYIKNDAPTNQLKTLVTATDNGLTAEYISPLFDNEDEFFRLIKTPRAHLSAYAHIAISQFKSELRTIGRNNDHTILCNQDMISDGYCYRFSEPKNIKASKDSNYFISSQNAKSRKAIDILQLLSQIFFGEEQAEVEKAPNLRLQIRAMQNRLLMERDVIWIFNL